MIDVNQISFSLSGTSHWWKSDFVLNTLFTLKKFHDLRIKNIELVLPHFVNISDVAQIKKYTDFLKITIASIHFPKTIGIEDTRSFKLFQDISGVCECPYYVVHPPKKPLLENLLRMYESMETQDCILLLENIPGSENFLENCSVLSKNYANFGITIDLEHLMTRQEKLEDYKFLYSYIRNIHFRDYKPGERYVLPGKGIFNYTDVKSFFSKYENLITVEANFTSPSDVVYCQEFLNSFLRGSDSQ